MSTLLPFVQNQLSQLTLNIEHLTKDITLVQQHLESKISALKKETTNRNDNLQISIEQLKQQVDYQSISIKDELILLQDNKIDSKEAFQMMDSNRNTIYEDIELLKNELNYQRKHFEDLLSDKCRKLDPTQLQESFNQLKDQFKQTRQEEANQLQENQLLMRQLVNANKKGLLQEIDRVNQNIELIKQDINQIQCQSIKQPQIETLQNQIQMQLQVKAELSEVQNAITSQQTELQTRLQEFKDEVKGVLEIQSAEFFSILNRKANQQEVAQLMKNCVTEQMMKQQVNDKVPIQEFQHYLSLIENIALDLQKKCDQQSFEIFKEEILISNQNIQSELMRKVAKSKVKELMDKKANHEDVQKAFHEMQMIINKKVQSDDYKQFTLAQQKIYEQINTENILGRWFFKGTFLCPGSVVPWNIQVNNTQQENFLWEKDKGNIIVVSPGIYEIKLGFFSKKKPKIDVMVNGETVLGAINNSSYVIHHSSGRMKDIKASLTGLTLYDFLHLPARSRLTITYQGDLGEGFLNLRKL